MSEPVRTRFEVLGERVELPLHIAAAEAFGAVFTADAGVVDRRLPVGLAPVLVRPGRALVAVLAVRYLDNPLGTYDEVVVAELARPAGSGMAVAARAFLRGHIGLHVSHMPVSETFTCEAGRTIWSYPKTVDDLDLDLGTDRGRAEWGRGGEPILGLRVRRGGAPMPGVELSGVTYTTRDGEVLRTSLRTRFQGLRVRSAGGSLRLRQGAEALGLDTLGLDGRAFGSASVDRAELTFGPARPLDPGSDA